MRRHGTRDVQSKKAVTDAMAELGKAKEALPVLDGQASVVMSAMHSTIPGHDRVQGKLEQLLKISKTVGGSLLPSLTSLSSTTTTCGRLKLLPGTYKDQLVELYLDGFQPT